MPTLREVVDSIIFHRLDGDSCVVVTGTHKGKSGVVQDSRVSKTSVTFQVTGIILLPIPAARRALPPAQTMIQCLTVQVTVPGTAPGSTPIKACPGLQQLRAGALTTGKSRVFPEGSPFPPSARRGGEGALLMISLLEL